MTGLLETLLVAAFVAGLLGGVHCAAMCGGIVGGVCSSPGSDRARWPQLLGFNLGRIATYALAGTLAGALGQSALWLRGDAVTHHIAMTVAGAALLILALYVAGVAPLVSAVESAGAVLWRHIRPLSRRFLPVETPARAFGLGLVWGWLPCGMVYAVLLTAAATGNALHGALVMAAFGAATLPNLLAFSMVIQRFRRAGRSRVARIGAALGIAGVGLFGVIKGAHASAFSLAALGLQ